VTIDAGVAISLVTGAVTLGIALGRQAAHTERIKALERFRDRTGARIADLEKLLALERAERRLTRGQGVEIVEAVPKRIGEEDSDGPDS
jgi:hypothetical protein